MSAPKSYSLRRGRQTGRLAHRLIFAAGFIGPILLLVLGCPINVLHPETEEQFATQRAAGTKALTAFSFTSPAATGTIDENAKTIRVNVPYGTSVTALVATFATTGASVKVGSTAQVSGSTANDFSAPVTYAVTAEDGSTTSYVVTVTVSASSAKAITAFSFASPAATGTIDENAKFVRVNVPSGTNVTALVASFTITGASVKVGSTAQVSGTTENDFSEPVAYTVTAADGSVVSYTVKVVVAPSSAKAITWFGFVSPAATGAIDESARLVPVTVPFGTNVTALVATFTTDGVSVKVGSTVQVSGTTANNFSAPVAYTVTAGDGTTASYTVTVTVAPSSAKAITAFYFASPPVNATILSQDTKYIELRMPSGTSLTALVATFTTTGMSVKVGSTVQVSGITANNFSAAVTYTVTAADGSTADYAVKVYVNPPDLAITAFSFANPPATGVIDQDAKTITVTVPHGTDVTALVANFTTTGKRVTGGTAGEQVGGVTANDFSFPHYYVVWGPDVLGWPYTPDYVQYLVTVKIEGSSSAKAITAFSFASPPATGTIDEGNKVIRVTVPNGTDVTSLKATFTTTGASVYVGSTRQVSGTTANNCMSFVSYRVRAEDGSYVDYTVIVTSPSNARVVYFDVWIDYYNGNEEISGMGLPGFIDEGAKTIHVYSSPWWYNPIDVFTGFMTTGVSVRVGSTEYPVPPGGNVSFPYYPFPGKLTVIALDGTTVDYFVQDGY